MDEWVQDRIMIPRRRAALLLSVEVARSQEGKKRYRTKGRWVTRLLYNIARMPDVLVREIAEFRYGELV